MYTTKEIRQYDHMIVLVTAEYYRLYSKLVDIKRVANSSESDYECTCMLLEQTKVTKEFSTISKKLKRAKVLAKHMRYIRRESMWCRLADWLI